MADAFAEATADILETLGVSATYTPSGGAGISTKVVVEEDLGAAGEFDHLQDADQLVTVLRVDTGDVNGVGTPANGDTIEITDADSPYNGTTFTVHEPVGRDAYVSQVAVT